MVVASIGFVLSAYEQVYYIFINIFINIYVL